jgi:hypothetical protein
MTHDELNLLLYLDGLGEDRRTLEQTRRLHELLERLDLSDADV